MSLVIHHGKSLFLIVVGIIAASSGDTRVNGATNLTWQGATYTITYSFTTDCTADLLLQAFLQPEHVMACMKRANLRIEVADSTPLQNRIIYTYSYLISQLRLQFNRRADTLARRVYFTMEACTTSGSSIVPTVRSSHGWYAITPLEKGCRVDYWQQTTLDRELQEFHLYFIRRDTRRVLRNQERYVAGGLHRAAPEQ
jgi:hypothetical protein